MAVNAKGALVIEDRAEAIQTAVSRAGEDDVILIAGKGHEDYQEIQGVKHHFSDFEEGLKALRIRYEGLNDMPKAKATLKEFSDFIGGAAEIVGDPETSFSSLTFDSRQVSARFVVLLYPCRQGRTMRLSARPKRKAPLRPLWIIT